MVRIEVVHARPDRQTLIRLSLPAGSTVAEAVARSGLGALYPELDPTAVGIFGRRCSPDTVLQDGDRVELYRPLSADPKEIRRRRARGANRRSPPG